MELEENSQNESEKEQGPQYSFETPIKNQRPKTQQHFQSAGYEYRHGDPFEAKFYSNKSNKGGSNQVSSIKDEVNSDNLRNEEIFKAMKQNALMMLFQEEIRMIQAESETPSLDEENNNKPEPDRKEQGEADDQVDLKEMDIKQAGMLPSPVEEKDYPIPNLKIDDALRNPMAIEHQEQNEHSEYEQKLELRLESNQEGSPTHIKYVYEHLAITNLVDENKEASRNPEISNDINFYNLSINTGKGKEKEYKEELFHQNIEVAEHISEKHNIYSHNEPKISQDNTDAYSLNQVQKTTDNVKKLQTGNIELTTVEKAEPPVGSNFQEELNKTSGEQENYRNFQTKDSSLKKDTLSSEDSFEGEESVKDNIENSTRIAKIASGVTRIHSEQAPNFITAMRQHLYLDLLACSYSSGKCELMNGEGELKGSLQLHSSSVIDMNWMLDNYIISCNEVECCLFDTTAEKKVRNFRIHLDPIYVVKPLFGSYLFASASCDKTVILWDLRDSKPVNAFLAHTQDITALDFSLNGGLLASCSEDSYCKVWSLFKGCCYRTLNLDKNVPLTSCCFSKNNEYILLSSLNSEISLWDWRESEKLRSLKDHRNENHMIESHLGFLEDKENFVLSGSEDGFLFGWNVDSETIVLKKDLRSFYTESSKDQDYVVKFVQMNNQVSPLKKIFVNFMEDPDILRLDAEFLGETGLKSEYD